MRVSAELKINYILTHCVGTGSERWFRRSCHIYERRDGRAGALVGRPTELYYPHLHFFGNYQTELLRKYRHIRQPLYLYLYNLSSPIPEPQIYKYYYHVLLKYPSWRPYQWKRRWESLQLYPPFEGAAWTSNKIFTVLPQLYRTTFSRYLTLSAPGQFISSTPIHSLQSICMFLFLSLSVALCNMDISYTSTAMKLYWIGIKV